MAGSWSTVATAAILVVVFSGCVTNDETGTAPPPSAGGDAGLSELQIPWVLTECRFVVGIVSAPTARLAPYLPKGFRAISLGEHAHPSAPNPGSEGNIGVEAFICKEGQGLNETVTGISYGSYFSTVAPPPELRRTDVKFHFLKWDVLIPDAPRRALLQSYGIPAREGSASIAQFTRQGETYAVDATLSLNGTSVARIVGADTIPEPAGSFIEYTQTPGGIAAWYTKYTPVAVGTGRVKFAAGSFGAKLAGTDELQGLSFGGMVSFKEGTLKLPAQPTAKAA